MNENIIKIKDAIDHCNEVINNHSICQECKNDHNDLKMLLEKLLEIESSSIMDIFIERKRQIEVEGFDVYKDECYKQGQLALAAVAYATPKNIRKYFSYWNGETERMISSDWPDSWLPEMWKPAKDATIAERKRELVKAGALILAEMDRLDRLEEKQ